MTITTQVPAITFTSSGPQIPSDADILTGVQADQNTAFGGGVNSDLSTPQGQLAQSMTAIISDKNAQILEVINGIDPATNSGRWQDAIGRIYFMDRTPGRGTVVQATCYGLVGAFIPAGSLAQDANGHIYASTANATIGANGQVDVQFQCQEDGPIACPSNTLNRIFVAVTGWERIDNAAAGVPGALMEGRLDFERRREASVAIGSTSMVESVRAAIWALPGVVDVYAIDNDTDAAITKGATNFSIPAHCLYVAVAGGNQKDIAEAIKSRKSVGCSTVGNTSYTIEMREGYVIPYPSYTYYWQTPAAKPVYFKVQLANATTLPSNIAELVKASIQQGFIGADGQSRAQIGGRIYAGRFYAGIQALHSDVQIISITTGFTSAAGAGMVELGIDQLPTLDPTNITVELV